MLTHPCFNRKTQRVYLFHILLLSLSAIFVSAVSYATDNVISKYPATPEKVVASYCKNVFNGVGLSSKTWAEIKKYTTWIDAPGWDITVVAKNYDITSTEQYTKTAKVRVKYQIVGYMESGEDYPRLIKDVKSDVVDFVLIHDDSLWKIEGPQDPPRISIKTAIELLEKEMSHNKDVKVRRFIREEINWLRKK